MNSVKIDQTITFEDNLNLIIGEGDLLVRKFEVVPFDHGVQDWSTPTFYLTNEKLIFHYDSMFEIYELSNLEISVFGQRPRFSIIQHLLEGSYTYSATQLDDFKRLKSSEVVTKFVFNEPGQITREFVLREGVIVNKSYQTWAMAQIILNTKHHLQSDPTLDEIMLGGLSRYNRKTVLTFIAVVLGYFALKALSLAYFPDTINSILDFLFGIVLIAMLVWSAATIEKNLKRYKACYYSYYSSV